MANKLGLAGLTLLISAALGPAETIDAAGATFPAPIYQRWFEEFYSLHPDLQINYQALGAGAGIRQLMEGTMDFGASDMPMTDRQMSKIARFKVLHFPTVLGGVVPAYNVAGIHSTLRFSGETLAGIFLGAITRWNDPALRRDNPGVVLPDAPITVVHRSDGSGTSFVWTDFLSKVSPEWSSRIGAGTSVRWPTGLGGKGSDGVAGLMKLAPNSIGYVELIYAVQNKMGYGLVRNASGEFVQATPETISEAARDAAQNMPDDFRVSITNPPGKFAYPISSFTWLLIPNRIESTAKRDAIRLFLEWMLNSGQEYARSLSYARLPSAVVAKELRQIALIQ